MGTEKLEKATFAGGCFWCMEPPFEGLEGVQSVRSGYTGGHVPHPTYEAVCGGATGHTEAVRVLFDPAQTPYERLLEVFWRNIDPTTLNQQFADVGSQYRTGIFYHSPEQKQKAEASKKALETCGKYAGPIVTEISEAGAFYEAEEYHQGYAKKNPVHYRLYRQGSGREGYLCRLWGAKNPPA